VLPPSFAMTVTPATRTVEAKQPAVFSLQASAVGGASTIALSCQAYNVTCTFTPQQIAAGQSATVAVTPQFAGASTVMLVGDAGFAAQSAPVTVQVLDFYALW